MSGSLKRRGVALIGPRRSVMVDVLAWVPTTQQATFLYGVTVALAAYFTQETAFWLLGFLMIFLGVFWEVYSRFVSFLARCYAKYFDISLRLAVGASILSLVQTWQQKPAYAFLSRACAVLLEITSNTNIGQNQGANNIDDLIRATIYIVRGLFLVYLAIAAVNVFKLMQRDEDWQTAVRAPLIAVIMVAVVEGISALVAPNAGEGC